VKVGVLALQGAFLEHQKILESLAVDSPQVRLPGDLSGLDGLIIPGGESTTIGKLAVDFGLMDPLRSFVMNHAVWGTCAGSILLSKDARRSQPLLEIMDIQVGRNAFGRQVDSFEIDTERGNSCCQARKMAGHIIPPGVNTRRQIPPLFPGDDTINNSAISLYDIVTLVRHHKKVLWLNTELFLMRGFQYIPSSIGLECLMFPVNVYTRAIRTNPIHAIAIGQVEV